MPKRKRINRATGLPGTRNIRKPNSKLSKPLIDTKSEVKVRSSYEKICVEYFSKSGIKFIYEPLMILDGHQYRPDFFLPDQNLFIEICGMNHLPYYSDRIEKKRKLYQKNGLTALFINFSGKGSLTLLLEKHLSPFLLIQQLIIWKFR